MKELHWGGFGSSVAATKLINRRESFLLAIEGEPAEALQAVMGPGARLNRETMKRLAGQFSLTTLPAVLVYALSRAYELNVERLDAGGLRIRFDREPEKGGAA